jgi:hypothetical protein
VLIGIYPLSGLAEPPGAAIRSLTCSHGSEATRDELTAWTARLDELGVEHTGVRDEQEPFHYATVVFRDPDNIQLELFWSSAS